MDKLEKKNKSCLKNCMDYGVLPFSDPKDLEIGS